MRKLLELIHIINRNKVKHIEVVGNLPPRKTKVQEFYKELSFGNLSNDQEAAAYFYDAPPDDRNYKELKKRLSERLYNTALFVDIQQAKYDDLAKAYYSCWKNFAIAKVLIGRGAYLNAEDLLNKTLKQSIKYDFNELVLNICRQLRSQYGSIHFNKKKHEYYNQLYHTYWERNEAEVLSEEYYSTLTLAYHGSKNVDMQKLHEQAEVYLKELKPLVEKYDAYRLNVNFYIIRLTSALGINDHASAIQVCEEAIDFFQSKPKYSHVATNAFYKQLFLLYWQKKDYEKGESLLQKASKIMIDGNLSWFTHHNYFFLLCLHAKKYDRAQGILEKVTTHPRLKTLPERRQEAWRIKEAYLFYLKD